MNLIYAELIAVFSDADGVRMGTVRVGGARKTVPLELLTDAAPGDKVLLCDGVAISRVAAATDGELQQEEPTYVSGNSGQAH